MSELLRVENLHVAVGGKTLLHGINLTVNTGEVHVIMGVNGAGKSTLLHAIMGNPAYEITEGHVYFEGEDITELSTDKRARLGIFFIFPESCFHCGDYDRKFHPYGKDDHFRKAAAPVSFQTSFEVPYGGACHGSVLWRPLSE